MAVNGTYTNQSDRNDYDIASSQTAQENFNAAANRLETVLDVQDADVKALMAKYEADGVSEKYQALANNWNTAGNTVRGIIQAIRTSLEQNDGIASTALTNAANAVHR